MSHINTAPALQYSAHCGKCSSLVSVAIERVLTGKPVACELCGTEMTLTRRHPEERASPRASKGDGAMVGAAAPFEGRPPQGDGGERVG